MFANFNDIGHAAPIESSCVVMSIDHERRVVPKTAICVHITWYHVFNRRPADIEVRSGNIPRQPRELVRAASEPCSSKSTAL